MHEYVGIDIGGTKIEAVLVDERNTVLNSCRIPARPGAQNVLDDVIGITRRLGGDPVAVGVGLPGQVDSVTGVVRDIVNLDIVKLELGREAGKALGMPVQVENDVNAAALGAVALIDDQVSAGDTVVFLNFGTGLAAGGCGDIASGSGAEQGRRSANRSNRIGLLPANWTLHFSIPFSL